LRLFVRHLQVLHGRIAGPAIQERRQKLIFERRAGLACRMQDDLGRRLV
jgi:hypothetical protein